MTHDQGGFIFKSSKVGKEVISANQLKARFNLPWLVIKGHTGNQDYSLFKLVLPPANFFLFLSESADTKQF